MREEIKEVAPNISSWVTQRWWRCHEGESDAEREARARKANFPQILSVPKTGSVCLAPSFPGLPSQAPQPPAPDQGAASQWAVFNPCWISFIFSPLCWASWAVIFPSVSSITDTTSLVQIKMHLRIIKKGSSLPPFLPSSNSSTQNICLWARGEALTLHVPSSGP